MNNKERWMASTALLVSILPFILVAASMQLLPSMIPVLHLAARSENAVMLPKYQYLYMGLMGLIPVALVILARILHAKHLVERNFISMVLAALCLGCVFLGVSVYGVIDSIIRYNVDLLMKFDFFGATAVVASLLTGMLCNFLPVLRRNDMLGLKNNYTMADTRVWAKVHLVAADVMMGTLFLFAVAASAISIVLDFRFGWVLLICRVAVVAALLLWSYFYSKRVSKQLSNSECGIRNAE